MCHEKEAKLVGGEGDFTSESEQSLAPGTSRRNKKDSHLKEDI